MLLILGLIATDCLAQGTFGNRNMNRFGRGRTAIPQVQEPQKEPEPLTAEQYVDEQMPKVVETLELDPFEEAIMRSTLVKYVQKRMQLRILNLEPQKMKEAFEKLSQEQNEELKAALPEEKFQTYLAMLENPTKTQRESKKNKRKRKKKSEDNG